MTGPRPTEMLRGSHILRVVWVPGTDLLEGHCWCGASQVADEPIALWEWLTAHPVGHRHESSAGSTPPPAARRLVPA
jgi:hypothetical protein